MVLEIVWADKICYKLEKKSEVGQLIHVIFDFDVHGNSPRCSFQNMVERWTMASFCMEMANTYCNNYIPPV